MPTSRALSFGKEEFRQVLQRVDELPVFENRIFHILNDLREHCTMRGKSRVTVQPTLLVEA